MNDVFGLFFILATAVFFSAVFGAASDAWNWFKKRTREDLGQSVPAPSAPRSAPRALEWAGVFTAFFYGSWWFASIQESDWRYAEERLPWAFFCYLICFRLHAATVSEREDSAVRFYLPLTICTPLLLDFLKLILKPFV